MALATFRFKSTGLKHADEAGFFAFLVKQQFNIKSNRSIQWCKFDGLSVTVEALEPEIIDFVSIGLGQVVETKTGYKYELEHN